MRCPLRPPRLNRPRGTIASGGDRLGCRLQVLASVTRSGHTLADPLLTLLTSNQMPCACLRGGPVAPRSRALPWPRVGTRPAREVLQGRKGWSSEREARLRSLSQASPLQHRPPPLPPRPPQPHHLRDGAQRNPGCPCPSCISRVRHQGPRSHGHPRRPAASHPGPARPAIPAATPPTQP